MREQSPRAADEVNSNMQRLLRHPPRPAARYAAPAPHSLSASFSSSACSAAWWDPNPVAVDALHARPA